MYLDGGAEGIRTPDPHNAIVVLYQLSYDPIRSGETLKTMGRFVKTNCVAPDSEAVPILRTELGASKKGRAFSMVAALPVSLSPRLAAGRGNQKLSASS